MKFNNCLDMLSLILIILFGFGLFMKQQSGIVKEKRFEKNKIVEEERLTLLHAKIDSSKKYLIEAKNNYKKSNYKSTLEYLDSSLTVYPENSDALNLKGKTLYKKKKYKEVTEFYEQFNSKLNKGESYLMLAKAFDKLGNDEDAMINAFNASKEGNTEGEKLYDKLNPLETILVGYQQICCDGTTSKSTGRGTCSSHGGVCKWSEPIYSKRRKFKITY